MADLFLFVTFGDLSLGFTKYIHNSIAPPPDSQVFLDKVIKSTHMDFALFFVGKASGTVQRHIHNKEQNLVLLEKFREYCSIFYLSLFCQFTSAP